MAELTIRPVREADIADVVEFSLLAWEPVFHSFERLLGHEIYSLVWPEWRTSQREAIEALCQTGGRSIVYVAELDGRVVGFVAYELNVQDKTGEVIMLAVHPDYQDGGIGTTLNTFALTKMAESGIRLARVETGGDPGHAPARRSYEKAGYSPLPVVRYFKEL